MSFSELPRPAGPRNRFPLDVAIQLRRNTLDFLTRTARKYGDVVPLPVSKSSPYLLVNDPEITRDVLVTQADHFMKGPALRRARDTLGDGLLASENPLHRRQRRLAQPAFHPQRVATYAEDMVRLTCEAAGDWIDGQKIDAHEQMMRLTLRIVAKTLFDADVEAEVRGLGEAMDVTVNMFTRAISPWGPLLNRLPLPSNFRFQRSRALLHQTIDRFIAERRANGVAGRRDLLSMLLRATDAEDPAEPNGAGTARPAQTAGGMSNLQLRDESLTIFTAGHETTANALTFTWYLLALHPEAEAGVHAEVDGVLKGELPTMADVERLPFVRACLAESMRLYPPAWAVARQAKEDLCVGDMPIAAGTVVLMSQWVTHRDPRWWPSPEKFDPARWSEAKTDRPRYAYFPFGGGPRSCIGEAFAWAEAILVLATIAQRWSMRLLSTAPLELVPTITLRPKRAVPMVLRKRETRSFE